MGVISPVNGTLTTVGAGTLTAALLLGQNITRTGPTGAAAAPCGRSSAAAVRGHHAPLLGREPGRAAKHGGHHRGDPRGRRGRGRDGERHGGADGGEAQPEERPRAAAPGVPARRRGGAGGRPPRGAAAVRQRHVRAAASPPLSPRSSRLTRPPRLRALPRSIFFSDIAGFTDISAAMSATKARAPRARSSHALERHLSRPHCPSRHPDR